MLERQVEALKEQQDLLLPESDRLRDDIESLEAEVEKLSAERLVANSRIEHLETALRDSEIEKERNLRVLQDMMTEQAELAEGKDFRIKSLEKQVQELNNKHQVFAAMEQKRDTVEVTPKSVNSELEEAKLLNTQLWALVELQMKEYEKASWEAQGTANRTEKKKEQAARSPPTPRQFRRHAHLCTGQHEQPDRRRRPLTLPTHAQDSTGWPWVLFPRTSTLRWRLGPLLLSTPAEVSTPAVV